ncbi:MAG: GAF domain-containing protein, partial [Candidatus Eremiobacteraeota bacterium]|nr:GAF domain-containing protein [Candidatus Eremiobacteraeota bacterium]
FINGIQGNREDARRFGLSALRGALTGQDSLNYWCALEGLAYSGLFPLESGQQELECHTPNSKGARETYLGLRFQSQGDYLSAFRHHSRLFETAAPPSWRNGLKLPSAITSLRRLLLHLPPYAERLRRDMLSCFRKKLTECKRHVKRFPIARSHVLRENAWLLRFEGQGECCLQRVSQASETAAQKGLRMEELHSYQEELELRRSLNLDAVQTRRKVGDLKRQIFGETDGTEGFRYLQNLETFKQLLEVAPQLSLALSSAELVERALECAKELFNQAQCAVLHRDGSVLASNQDCTYLPSETLLRQVVQTGQPQLSSNLPSSSASLTLHGVDSRILAPVFAGNKVTYLIWVCQFEVPDMYDEEDIKLIKYLSRLMGITLDSLQLLEEESSVTRALEEEAARNRKLFEHSPIAHAVFSVHSEPLQGNQAWDQLAPSSEEYQTRTFTTHLSDGRHLVSCYPQELEDESPLIKRQHEQLDSLQQILKKDALEPLGELLSKIQDADLEDVASLTGQTRELVDSLGTVISELRDEHVLN